LDGWIAEMEQFNNLTLAALLRFNVQKY